MSILTHSIQTPTADCYKLAVTDIDKIATRTHLPLQTCILNVMGICAKMVYFMGNYFMIAVCRSAVCNDCYFLSYQL